MATEESGESRIALVIGNADYIKMRKLKSTRADADEIASALAEVGFTSHECDAIGVFSKLTPYHNQTQQGMNALLADFSIASQDADMAVIYYSGHGIEIESRNFLIPTDAELRNVASGSNLTFESLLGFPRFAACSLRDARRKIHHRFVGRSASA